MTRPPRTKATAKKAIARTRDGKPPTDHAPAENPTNLPMLRTSERRDFKRCPQRWHWGWRDGLEKRGTHDVKLWFGTGWHLVMAHRYRPGKKRGTTPLKVWRDWAKDEMAEIRVNLTGDDEYKQEVYVDALGLGEEMIGNYLDQWGKDEDWEVIQPEKPFEVVIADTSGVQRVLFCGTYDGIIRTLDGIWLLEHKTAKAITLGHLTLDDQAGGYLAIATRELQAAGLIGPKEQVKGILYNFARKAPKDTRPVNADGLAMNKATTKAHYFAALPEEAVAGLPTRGTTGPTLAALEALAVDLNVAVYGDVAANQPHPLFVREPIYRTARERNGIITRIQAEVEHMEEFRAGRLPLYKTPTRDCSWDCNFYQMCVMHESGGTDWEDIRDGMYKKRDPYQDHRKSAADSGDS